MFGYHSARPWRPRVAGGLAALALLLHLAAPAATQERAAVTGTVRSAQGQPLSGALVRVAGETSRTLTDVRGEFRLTGLPAAEITVIAEHLGYAAARETVRATPGSAARVDLVLRESAVQMQDLVVSVSREAQRRAETPATVHAVGGEEIRAAGAAHPSEIMRRVPGVWVSVTGGEGHQTAIRQPLTTSPVYLFLEDGVPTRSTGFFNHNALYEINVPQADRIEVTKGPATALYGSDAIGGIINVSTRAPSGHPSAELRAEGGAFGWNRMLASGSTAWGGHGLRADVNLTRTDGWRDATDYRRRSATLRWDATLGARATMRTVATASDIDQSTAGSSAVSREDWETNPTVNYTPISFRAVRAVRVSSELAVRREQSLFTLTPFARWNEMDLLANWTLASDPTLSTTGHRSLGVLAKARHDVAPLRTRLVGGVDMDVSPGSRFEQKLKTTREGKIFTASEVDGVVYDYDVTFLAVSPYLQAESSPADRLRLVAGLRYDRMQYDYRNHLGELQTGRHRRPADATPSYSHLSPKLGATYEVNAALNVFASYGHGFRAPSEGQLFRQGQTANTVGLRPVRVDSYESGIRGTLANRVSYDLAVYTMTKRDDILGYQNPDGTRETLNAGETRHRGVETGIGAALTPEVRIDLGYSYARHTYGQWQPRAGTDLGGNEMETAPRHLANVSLGYAPAWLPGSRFGAEVTRVGSYWMDAENTHRYAGHTLVNLRGAAPVYGGVGVFARLTNATDRRFAESASFNQSRGEEFAPGMPRTLYVGLQLN